MVLHSEEVLGVLGGLEGDVVAELVVNFGIGAVDAETVSVAGVAVGVAAGEDVGDDAVLEGDNSGGSVVEIVTLAVNKTLSGGAVNSFGLAEEITDHIEVVDVLLNDLTAGGCVGGPPVNTGDAADPGAVNKSNGAGGDKLAGHADDVKISVLETDAGDKTLCLGGVA